MEALYCDNQEMKDGTLKAGSGLPSSILNVILDPEETDILATKDKVWFDDQRLVFNTPHTSNLRSADETGYDLVEHEPGWRLSEIKKAAMAAATATEAKRAQRISPSASWTSMQSSEDAVDKSSHFQPFHSCTLTNWFQDRTRRLPLGMIPLSSEPICVSGDESNTVNPHCFQEPHTDRPSRLLLARTGVMNPLITTWLRSSPHRRPRLIPSQLPIGSLALPCPSSMGVVKSAVCLAESSDSESDNDKDDDDDDDTIAVGDLEDSLHFGSIKSSKSSSRASSLGVDQDPLQRVRTKIHKAEQASRLELIIEQLIQRLSTQIRHEGPELAPFFWAWP